ncbi:MAG: alpha/beta hydrolase family protein [bacterium]
MNKLSLLGAVGLTLLAFVSTGQAQEASAEDFAKLPFLKNIDISPDGQKISTLFNYQDEYMYGVFNVTNGVKPLYTMGEDSQFKIRKSFWVRPDRIVFSVRYAGKRYGTETVETRLYAMNPDGTKIKPLFETEKQSKNNTNPNPPIQIQDNIVSLLKNDPERIAVQYRDHGAKNVAVHSVRVDTTSGHGTYKRGIQHIQNWVADVNGDVVIGSGIINDREKKLIVKLEDGSWKDLSDRANAPSTFYVLGKSDQPNIYYVASNHQTDTDALYLFDAATNSFGDRIYHNPSSDIYDIKQDSRTGKAIGVYYAGDDTYIHWLEDNFIQSELNYLSGQFPDDNVVFVNLNQNETHAVIKVEHGNRPGRYYLYDLATKDLTQMPPQYPTLEGVTLGKIISTEYPARDGLTIPAFITLPPGLNSLSEASNLPFIMLPHGGPNARDFVDFDYEAQYFASQGYGVLQMNFRGSTGYGAAFKNAGNKQWGQAMQDDITDGANWLVTNGYADGNRIAIAGGSYGGYAALMGAIRTPDLYHNAPLAMLV